MDRPSRKIIILSENVGRFLLRGESYLSRSGFLLVAGETGRDILDLAARERPAAAVLGFAGPAQADSTHHYWVNDIQQQVSVPHVDTSVHQSR